MTDVTTKVFKSGNSRAVRLPRHAPFELGTEVTVSTRGDVVTIHPAKPPKLTPAELVARLRALPSPGAIEIRDTEEIPERPGL